MSLVLLNALFACIIYDSDYDGHCGGGPDGMGDCSDPFGDDSSSDDTAVDDSGEPAEIEDVLSFHPGQAEQGEVFPAVLRLDEGDADLSTATGLNFYGDVEVLHQVAEAGKITLILQVAADAELGPVDLVVELADGSAELLPGAFEIFAAGSGHSGTGWTDEECE